MIQASSQSTTIRFKRNVQLYRYKSTQGFSFIFHPVSFLRNHIKPIILARTQWNSRLVVLIKTRRFLAQLCGNLFYPIARCGGSNRSLPYRVQYQMLLNHLDNGFSCYLVEAFASVGLNDRVRIAQFNWCNIYFLKACNIVFKSICKIIHLCSSTFHMDCVRTGADC